MCKMLFRIHQPHLYIVASSAGQTRQEPRFNQLCSSVPHTPHDYGLPLLTTNEHNRNTTHLTNARTIWNLFTLDLPRVA